MASLCSTFFPQDIPSPPFQVGIRSNQICYAKSLQKQIFENARSDKFHVFSIYFISFSIRGLGDTKMDETISRNHRKLKWFGLAI